MAASDSKYDCFHDMPEVEPNGDISGPGVITGFLGTAYLAMFVLAGYYLLAFDPNQDPYKPQPNAEPNPNPPDNVSGGGEQSEMNNPPSQEDDTIQQQDGLQSTNHLRTSSPRHSSEEDQTTNPTHVGGEWIEMNNLSSHRDDTILQQEGPHSAGNLPTASPGDLSEEDWNPNPIDIWFLNHIRRLLHIRWYQRGNEDGEAKIERAFNECMRSICDNQLMTGVGILFGAFCILQGPDGQGIISAYHWQIAVYLAWLSNLTYTTGLTFLRKYLAHHKTERLWRTISMMALFLLVFVSFQPLVYFNWEANNSSGTEAQPSNASSYAVCFFQPGIARERMKNDGFDTLMPFSSGVSVITSSSLLVFSFTTRLFKLSRTSSRFVRITVRKSCSDATKAFIYKQLSIPTTAGDEVCPGYRRPMLGFVGLAVLLTARLYFDLFTSMLSEVYWTFVAGAWVSVRIFKTRSSANVDEDTISFGQILAVFLLLSPIVTIFVAMWPLRPDLRELRELHTPVSSKLRRAHTFSVYPANFKEFCCHLADYATSYDTLGSSLVLFSACVILIWTTGLYFWSMASLDSGGFEMIILVSALALMQPISCAGTYFLSILMAINVFSHQPRSEVTEATTQDAAPTTEHVSPESGTSTGQTAEERRMAVRYQRALYIITGFQTTIAFIFSAFALHAEKFSWQIHKDVHE